MSLPLHVNEPMHRLHTHDVLRLAAHLSSERRRIAVAEAAGGEDGNVAEHGGSDSGRDLVEILRGEEHAEPELAGLRKYALCRFVEVF